MTKQCIVTGCKSKAGHAIRLDAGEYIDLCYEHVSRFSSIFVTRDYVKTQVFGEMIKEVEF